MKAILYPVLCLLILQGCRSYSYIDNYEITNNKSRLPKLTAITDQEIFNSDEDDYSYSYSRSLGSSSNIYKIERQFNKYVLEHLTTPHTEKFGYAVMRINHMKVRNDLSLLSIAAGVSLGLTSILGIPAGRYNVELDISLEILDIHQNIIEIYNGKGKDTALIGVYYGYGENGAKEKCIYESMEMCLNQINEKVMRNFDRIEKELIRVKKEHSVTKKETE